MPEGSTRLVDCSAAAPMHMYSMLHSNDNNIMTKKQCLIYMQNHEIYYISIPNPILNHYYNYYTITTL